MTNTTSQAASTGTAAWRTRITRLLGIRYPILQAGSPAHTSNLRRCTYANRSLGSPP